MKIQSPEGQKYLKSRHKKVMQIFMKYPSIRQVYDEKWEKCFLKTILKIDDDLNIIGYPEIYLAPEIIKIGILSSDYLNRVDSGLEFLLRKAKGQNKTDLIGNLRKGSSAAVFEVMLAWALCKQFSEDQIEPYPKTQTGSKKTMDFAVLQNKSRVLIEAMTIYDEKEISESKINCMRKNGFVMGYYPNNPKHIERIIKNISDKILQRKVREPFFVCFHQFAFPPDPGSVVEDMGKLLCTAITSNDSFLVGLAYYWNGSFITFQAAENRAQKLNVKSQVLSDIRLALSQIYYR